MFWVDWNSLLTAKIKRSKMHACWRTFLGMESAFFVVDWKWGDSWRSVSRTGTMRELPAFLFHQILQETSIMASHCFVTFSLYSGHIFNVIDFLFSSDARARHRRAASQTKWSPVASPSHSTSFYALEVPASLWASASIGRRLPSRMHSPAPRGEANRRFRK